MKTIRSLIFLISLALILQNLGPAPAAARPAAETLRVSISSGGTQGNGKSERPAISADGRWVAYSSYANNLVDGDSNGYSDIFLYDRQDRITTRVSIATNGDDSDGDSFHPSISSDGRYIAFDSLASNLVSGDTNGRQDVFVFNRLNSQTLLVSKSTNGDLGNNSSHTPAVSGDGIYVAFVSNATNLVTNDGNGKVDIFLRDLRNSQTRRISVSSSGVEGNGDCFRTAISNDGAVVAFASHANNLVSGDTNGFPDIFSRDWQANQTRRVSVSSDGTQANDQSDNPAISGDGRYVAFTSHASNLIANDNNVDWDVFIYNLTSSQIELISSASNGTLGDNGSNYPSISYDGTYIVFDSGSTNLIGGDTNNAVDVFLKNRSSGQTSRLSVSSGGTAGNGYSGWPAISDSSQIVAFASSASNLVSSDTNNVDDIFTWVGAETVPPPFASFSASPTQGAAPLNVQFTDASTGQISSWYWEFGDGSTSTQQSPVHTYSSYGDYTVALTVTGDGGSDTETRLNYIHIPPPPTADFSASPTQGGPGLVVGFTDASNGEISNWFWEFGDGSTTTLRNPAHTYASAGLYSVSLTISGTGGSNQKTRMDYIRIYDLPVANFSAEPTSGEAPLEVQFFDLSTGPITSWSWTFGDGSGSTLQNPGYVYPSPGIYNVKLVVAGPGGQDEELKSGFIIVRPRSIDPGGGKVFLPMGLQKRMQYYSSPWEQEENDNYIQANGPLPLNGVIYGYPDDQKDYFSVYVPEPTQLQIDLENHTGNGVQLQLFYQSISNQIGFAYREPYRLAILAEIGEYFIYIFTEKGHNVNTPYILRLSTP